MKFIFWQNILSLHQSAFIRNLALENEVILIVEEEISEERIKHGWSTPEFGKANIIVCPDDDKINFYLNDKETIHIFTGINSFPMVYKVFKKAIKNGSKILVQAEPYNWIDSKAWLRSIKYKLLQLKYGKKINGILAISSAAARCYKKAGFPKNKIFAWAYFTENTQTLANADYEKNGLQLLFVGSIDERKNILGVLPLIRKHTDKFTKFSIIGNGALEKQLAQFTENDKIEYIGGIPNSEISRYLVKSDILILPSVYDGWGAVVNEALMEGTKVLCSATCGASDLIKGNRGKVYSYTEDDFESQFLKIIDEGSVSEVLRDEIKKWSKEHISGEIAAEYFVNIIKYIYNNEKIPVAPWM